MHRCGGIASATDRSPLCCDVAEDGGTGCTTDPNSSIWTAAPTHPDTEVSVHEARPAIESPVQAAPEATRRLAQAERPGRRPGSAVTAQQAATSAHPSASPLSHFHSGSCPHIQPPDRAEAQLRTFRCKAAARVPASPAPCRPRATRDHVLARAGHVVARRLRRTPTVDSRGRSSSARSL